MLLLTNKDSIRLRGEQFGLGQRTVLVFTELFSLPLPSLPSLSHFLLFISPALDPSAGWSLLLISVSLFFSFYVLRARTQAIPPCSLQPTAETQLQ